MVKFLQPWHRKRKCALREETSCVCGDQRWGFQVLSQDIRVVKYYCWLSFVRSKFGLVRPDEKDLEELT